MTDELTLPTLSELDELERLAEAATPGPWRDADDPRGDEAGERYIEADYDGGPRTTSIAYDMRNNDRAYIVATQPATILRLISLARAGIAGAEDMRERAEQLAEVCDHDTLLDALATLKAHQGD